MCNRWNKLAVNHLTRDKKYDIMLRDELQIEYLFYGGEDID